MRKLTLFTAAALSVTSLGGFSLPAQAAQAGWQGNNKNVIVIQGSGLSDLQNAIDNLKNQYPGLLENCRPILPPCIPEQPAPPENETPDTDQPGGSDKPDTDQPGGNDKPDTDQPGGNDKPDTDQPGDNDKPDTDRPGGNDKPDTDQPGGSDKPDTDQPGGNDKPDTDQPGGSDKPDTDQPGGNDKPDTDRPGGNDKPDTDNPGTDESPDDGAQLTYAEQVVHLVNVERRKQGLNDLTIQEDVRAAAQVRAVEIQTSFSHTRPNGQSFSSALREQNVSFRGSGENIAWGQKSPEEVVTGWMNSDGHRANILNPKFTAIGVGHYQNASGVNYWTQLFIY